MLKHSTLKHYLLLIVVFGNISTGFAQEIHDKITNEICECAKEKQVETFDAIEPCFETAILKNLNALMEFHEAELIEDLDDSIFDQLGIRLTKECDYIFNMVPNPVKDEIPTESSENALKCSDAKFAELYYVQPKFVDSKVMDTTYVTISDNLYLERMNRGKTFSMLNLTWQSECAFELSFIKSNDYFKNLLSDFGDIYNYEIVSATENSFFVKLVHEGKEFHVEMILVED